MYTKIPQPEKGTSYLRYHPKASKLLLKRRDSIPLLLDILFLTFSYAHINATTTRADETCMPQWPEGGGRASKTCEKKGLCEPVCVRGTSSLQLTSQRPWATSRQFAWTPLSVNFLCLSSVPLKACWTGFMAAAWFIDLPPLDAVLIPASRAPSLYCTFTFFTPLRVFSAQSRGAMPHAASNSDAQGRCSMLASLGVVVQTPKVQFQPRKKMFQYIGPG